jgi:hypothetical protein
MDDPNLQLENELKALRPRRPSVLLRARVARELGEQPGTAPLPARPARRYTSATSLQSWKWLGWRLAAAAALAAVVFVGVRFPRPPAAPEVLPGPALARTAPESAVPFAPSGPVVASTAPSSSSSVFQPVKAANVLYDLRDEGLVLLEDQTPARRVRARYVDTYTWENPANGSSLRWSVPRDEVRMVPARFQ